MQQFYLRDFRAEDLEQAGKIALQIWGDESVFIPASVREGIYSYLVRYCFVPGSHFSCALTDENGVLCAFLLASAPGAYSCAAADAWAKENLPEESFPFFESYKAYLDGNTKAEETFLEKDEVLLLLFASIRKGCGSCLMEEFKRRCRKHRFRSMLLWTDDTCNFSWYQKHGFSEPYRKTPRHHL
jgi:hypothetical protein